MLNSTHSRRHRGRMEFDAALTTWPMPSSMPTATGKSASGTMVRNACSATRRRKPQPLDIIIPENLRQRHWAGFDATMRSGKTRYGANDLLAAFLALQPQHGGQHHHISLAMS